MTTIPTTILTTFGPLFVLFFTGFLTRPRRGPGPGPGAQLATPHGTVRPRRRTRVSLVGARKRTCACALACTRTNARVYVGTRSGRASRAPYQPRFMACSCVCPSCVRVCQCCVCVCVCECCVCVCVSTVSVSVHAVPAPVPVPVPVPVSEPSPPSVIRVYVRVGQCRVYSRVCLPASRSGSAPRTRLRACLRRPASIRV